MRLAEALWTHKAPPPQFIVLQLCRDVYHCTPSQLLNEDAATVYTHLLMLQVEAKINQARNK